MKIHARVALGLLALATASTSALANGIIIVPVKVDKKVYVTKMVPGYAWQSTPQGCWQLVYTQVAVYEAATVRESTFAIVPDPTRPCYKPPKPLPPPIHPSPQVAPAAQDAHDHGPVLGKPAGCGYCFPDCFLKTPCTCCVHSIVVLKEGSEDAKYFEDLIAKNLIAYRYIRFYTANADGSYTIKQ